MAFFWGVMAAVWIYDAVVGYTTFERTYKHDKFAFALYLMPFLYPLHIPSAGTGFPDDHLARQPCTAATFTIGLMLSFSKRINLFVVLFLCHWSLIGFSKVYFFGIPEDLLLASALVPALYLFFKEYIDVNFRCKAKPDLRVMNMLLLAMCSGLGVFFAATIWQQLVGMAG